MRVSLQLFSDGWQCFVSAITRNAANIIAAVSVDGGGAITSKGICYATNTSVPTINVNSYTNNGSGIGSVGGNITGLVPNAIYYVRAYAVNPARISYGTVSMFKTL